MLTESLVAVSADPRVELLVAAEAAGALLAWAEQRHLGVYASVRPPNPASERVLRKIGLRLTASYTDEDGVRNVYRRRPG